LLDTTAHPRPMAGLKRALVSVWNSSSEILSVQYSSCPLIVIPDPTPTGHLTPGCMLQCASYRLVLYNNLSCSIILATNNSHFVLYSQ
jgi:hypothetical protein